MNLTPRLRAALLLSVLTALLLPLLTRVYAGEGQLHFGWAATSITPPRPVAICGQYHTRISGEVHDPLLATALALETRHEDRSLAQAVWVSCDLVAIRGQVQQRLRQEIRKQFADLQPDRVFVSATHTHTAPALTDARETDLHPYDFMGSWAYRIPDDPTDVMHPSEYVDYLVAQLAKVVGEAWRARRPGGFSAALGHAVVAHNRRAVYRDGTARMYGNTADPEFSHIEGLSDHSVDALFFWRGDKLDGLALNVYCPSQEVEGETYLSADFWHDTRQALRAAYGDDLRILPLCGASGDQSPHLLWNKKVEQARLQQRGLAPRQEIAQRLLQTVRDVMPLARQRIRTQLDFRHRMERIPLPVWMVSEEQYRQAKATFEAGRDRQGELSSMDYIEWRVSRTLMARYEHQKQAPNFDTEVHLLRLGEVAVATNPFELFADYGVRIKERSPAQQTLVVQLTADCAAYLPTRRAVEGGGYSARIVDGVVGPEGGDVLVDRTADLLSELWNSP